MLLILVLIALVLVVGYFNYALLDRLFADGNRRSR